MIWHIDSFIIFYWRLSKAKVIYGINEPGYENAILNDRLIGFNNIENIMLGINIAINKDHLINVDL